MAAIELRDPEVARAFLTQGLWLPRVAPAAAATVRPALEQALQIVAAGIPLPPIGFAADLGHIVFELGREARPGRDLGGVTGLPAGLFRRYEDHVLGKFYADWTFDRAGDVLRHLSGRNRRRGLAFVVGQFLDRGGADGAVLSPAAVKALLDLAPDEVLARGWASLDRDGLLPQLADCYESL